MDIEMENRVWELYKKGFSDLEIAKELEIDTEDVEKIIEQRKKKQADHEAEKTKEEVPEEREHNEQLDKEIEDAMCFPMKRTVKL